MARPTTKTELLKLSTENFDKLLDFIDSLNDEQKVSDHEFKDNTRDKTVSDVLCHLHEWHNMMEKWYVVGMSGAKPVIPREGYTWKTLPEMNRVIQKEYAGTKLDDAIELFKKSHKTVMNLIEKHTDEELFEKKVYHWTGTTSLGAYFVSATSSHYDWGLKTVKIIKKK